ncbi:MAG: MBL fold metallo-hydrolase [Phycisphaerales bacterium]|nr:MBL fold metallo-hydrolase [Phycisphaerales bacterium]
MFFRQIYDENLAAASYLIGCQRTGEAIVIDPQRDIDRYETLASSHGLKIVAAAETHIHADFVSGAREFAQKGVKVYASDEGGADWKSEWLTHTLDGETYAHQLLRDGDTFHVGSIEFRALHTPGHTPEHICYMVTDVGGGATKPMGVLTGDFVFVGDLGRPDLLESAAGFAGKALPSAKQLFQSVRKFLTWEDYLQVWPAHGAGSACGKALGAVPQSTVGYEKLFNPAVLAASDEQTFITHILDGQPEPPLYFANMKRDNRHGPRVLNTVPHPRRLSIEAMHTVVQKKGLILDTRPWVAFKAAHIPGSLFLPLTASFSTDAGSLARDTEVIHLVVDPKRVDEAVRSLIRIGLDRFCGWFDANMVHQFGTYESTHNGTLVSTNEVSVEEARAMLDTQAPFVLDVRRATEFATGHITGAVNISHTRLLNHLDELPTDRTILVNCHSGGRSSRACALLQRNGFDACNLAGGMLAWKQSKELLAH